MKPYEVVSFRDSHFAYHQALGRLIRLTPGAAAVLKGEEEATDETLRAEVERLREAGFFEDVPSPWSDEASFEAALTRFLAAPRDKLELALAETCNLACRYCYCGTCRGEVEGHGVMTPETAVAAVERLFEVGARGDVTITFFGGEPLLGKAALLAALRRAEELAAARGVSVGYVMTTNATLVDDETAELVSTRRFGLMVSLDGPQALHDAQCPTRTGEGSWQAAVEGIRRIMKRRPVTVRGTLARPLPDLMELVRFYTAFGFSRIVLGPACNPMFPSPCDLDEADMLAYERQVADGVVPWMLAEIAAGRRPAYDPFESFEERLGCGGETVDTIKCGACHGTLTVSADGAMYPCHRFAGMSAWRIGSLESGIDDAKCRNFWYNYRRCIESACSKCWAYRICGGPCPWEIARPDGTFRMNTRVCEETKRWIAQGAWFAAQKEALEKGRSQNGNA